MNIKERLEAEHSKTLTIAIVNYVGEDKLRFKMLMDIFLGSDYRLTQRSAWPLGYIALEHPKLLTPYFSRFIKKLDDPSAHPGIFRNIFRVLQGIEIPEKYQGMVVDRAFKAIMSETQPAAVRAFAITTAANICRQYPELKQELLVILQELNAFPQLPSLRSRIKKALKDLAR